MLACAVAYDLLPTEGLLNEGIESITAADVAHFQGRGYTCRLLARGSRAGERVSAWVEPVLLRAGAPECAVLENYNMASYLGECAGSIVLMGQGAGRYPTASAVLRDLCCILHGKPYMLQADCRRVEADNGQREQVYYVRLPAALAGELPQESAELDGEDLRMITKPMPVSQMHAAAKRLRAKGAALFFAAMEG